MAGEASPASDDGPIGRVVLLAVAALSLALALHVRNGTISIPALALLTLSFGSLIWALRPAGLGVLERLGPRGAEVTVGAAVTIAIAAHLLREPASFIKPWDTVAVRVPFGIALSVAVATVALAMFFPRKLPRVRVAIAVAAFLYAGSWIIRHSPDPYIDVVEFHRDSIAAFLAGENPYDITFPDIYPPNSPFYGPGLVVDGRVMFGFLYPPLSLLMAIPGQVLLNDFRYSQLAATAGAAVLMAGSRRGRLGFLAGVLYMFFPRSFLVMELGWTEPFVVLLFALVLFCACRWRRALPYALGLLLASKQPMVLVLPLIPLLFERGQRLRALVKAGVVAAVITLPFALWNFHAFWYDVVELQFHQPFRNDSLSYLAAWRWMTGGKPPALLGFLAAGAAIVVALRRCPRTPAGFAHAVALVFFAFYSFNKQAFCNYYTAVLGFLCVALAAYRLPATEERRPLSSP
jgi:hypothetical protein